MNRWKLWSWLAGIIVCMAAVAVAAALWNNVASEWAVEAAAAQFALNRSPIDHIEAHEVSTAAGTQEVFVGTDAFGVQWYVFVFGHPMTVEAVPATRILSRQAILAQLKSGHVHPMSAQVAYLTASNRASFHTQATVMWEVYGRNESGQPEYLYMNAGNAHLIWHYVL